MKTIMKKLITIKNVSVLALVLLIVVGPSFVKGTAGNAEPGGVYLTDETVINSIAGKLHATISLYSVEEDIAAIEEVLNQYAVSANAGDLELWLSLHADDVVKMPPDAPAIFGKEELGANFKPLFDNFTFEEMAIFDVEIQLAGDWVFSRCNFTATMAPKAGGEPLYMDAKDLCIFERQADGSWKISRDCYNSNVPPAQ